jgi:hypothetical protein
MKLKPDTFACTVFTAVKLLGWKNRAKKKLAGSVTGTDAAGGPDANPSNSAMVERPAAKLRLLKEAAETDSLAAVILKSADRVVLQTIVKADRATARRDADLFYFRGRSTAGANPILAWCSGRNSQRHNCNDAGRKLIDEAHWLGREIDQIAQDYASSLPVYLQHW